MRVNPYLVFNGDCADAFKFYEKTLKGRLAVQTHENSSMPEGSSPEWRDRVLHARLEVGDTVLMGSDRPPGSWEATAGFSVSLDVENAEEAERIFSDLADGGSVTMPIEQTFFATRFGMLVDRFGIPWMVNFAGAAQ